MKLKVFFKRLSVLTGLALWVISCNKPVPVPVPEIEADFSSDLQEIFEGEKISFADKSTGNPTQWEWEFEGGDPSASTEQNPVVYYNTEGKFSVTLTARNDSKSGNVTKNSYITVISILEKGLLAHYPFDGNARDKTGNNPEGLLSDSVILTTDRFNRVDSAFLFFNGRDRIDLVADYEVNNQFSMFCWVKMNTQLTTKSNHVLNLDGTIGFLLRTPQGLRIVLDDPAGNRVEYQTNEYGYFNDQKWHHVGFTYNNGTLAVYVDGKLKGTASGDVTLPRITGLLTVGNHNTAVRPLKGKIDDVRIYDRVLSDDEVLRLSKLTY